MYNKLFAKIVRSSIWLEPTPTRLVWFMFIALMDEDGFVQFASVANVAHTARITDKEAQEAIDILEAPDQNSADDEHEGRRIEKVPGGWMVLNASKYRDLVTRDMIRQKSRDRVAKHRAKKRGNALVTQRNGGVTESDTDTIKEKKEKPRARCTQKEAEDFCLSIGLPASDGTAMFLHWEEKGWAKVKDWKLTIRKWQSFGYLPSQKQKPNGFRNTKPTPEQDAKLDRQMIEARQRYEQHKRAQRNQDQ